MSSATPAAALLPPLPRTTTAIPSFAPQASDSTRAAPGSALFELPSLRLLPEIRRDAFLSAESKPEPEAETPVQPQLEVGPAEDEYEREADAVADTVMRMPTDAASVTETEVDDPGARRKCSACEREDKVQREPVAEAEAESGPPTLAASAATLTSGGAPMAPGVQRFYEQRLGRDLSAVRIHQGDGAQAANDSISARAFTYGSHIWMGKGEAAQPSHTLSHEIAHVLQQTQPQALRQGDAGAAMHPVRRRVQRAAESYWIPSDPTLATPTAAHEHIVEKMGEANPSFITEAPIPNAGFGAGRPGFADLYKATTTVGVTIRSGTGRPGVPPVLRNFDTQAWWAETGHEPARGGAAFNHTTEGRPFLREEDDTLDGIAQAPRRIEVGEVKAGFQSYPRLTAARQLERYGRALARVAEAVNLYAGAPVWNPEMLKIERGRRTALPAGYGPNAPVTSDSMVRNLVLRRSSRGRSLHPNPPIEGHLIVGGDPDHEGVFNYFWVPDNLPAATSLAGAASTEWGELAARYETLVRDLRSSPLNVRRKPRTIASEAPVARGTRKLRAKPRLKLQSNLQIRPKLQIKPKLAPRRPQRTQREYRNDAFDHRLWERRRTTLGRDMAAFRRRHPTEGQNLEVTAAAQESEVLMQRRVRGYSARRPEVTTARRLRQFARLEFLVSRRGWFVGWLRRIFGRAYVQVARAYQRIAERFRRRMRAPRGVGGTWARAAFLALLNVLKAGAGIILGRTVAILAQRIESCMSAKMAELFDLAREDLDLSGFEEILAELEEHRTRIETIANSTATALAERFIGPYGPLFDALQTTLQGFSALSSLVSLVQWGVRVAACAAPPAAGCLWNLAIGALELIISQVVQSCWFLRKVTPYAMQLGFFAALPGQLADGIMSALRAILPESLHHLLCLDDLEGEVRQVAPPTESEIPCEDGPNARQPRAPQAVVDRIEELAEIDPEIYEELRSWSRRNGVPGNTPVDYDRVIRMLDQIRHNGMSAEELRTALEESGTTPDADDAFSSFVRETRASGAETTAANRRASERRRRREAERAAGAAATAAAEERAGEGGTEGGGTEAGRAEEGRAETGRAGDGEEAGSEAAGEESGTEVVVAEIVDPLPAGATVNDHPPVNPQSPGGGLSQFARLADPDVQRQPGDPIRISLYYWIHERWVVLQNVPAEFRSRGTFNDYRTLNYSLYQPIYFRAPDDPQIFEAGTGERMVFLDYEGIIIRVIGIVR